jgi:ethylbenzene dioxygenase ferredoxin component
VSDKLVFICKTSDLEPGTVKRVEIGDSGVAVYNIEGTYYVTDDRCTHGLSSLSEGELMGDEIECSMHFGAFHVPTGKPTLAPCSIALKTYRVETKGEDVFAEMD